MAICLELLDPGSFPQWLEQSCSEYVADLISSGSAPGAARQQAEASLHKSFPEGRPGLDNAVFTLMDQGGSAVGYIWVGRDHSDDPTAWWVWDILVDSAHRGKGYGREAMQLAEEYARSRGALTLGLNVFGYNASARGLYESLGYETTSIKMRKSLLSAGSGEDASN
ncbi:MULTISPECIES: GNAT family N-acetyltransferase [Arthrobacter]|uniref:GNAT family N-acetyltransferase n=1 Tax=Arthrobacter psychrochitiniphilus TaxID=291045 RepID=A0A2V3DUE0_9MICC|nr:MULTISPECIES: GNAT family N-acetyltransferase [Arthrobacter]NYG15748.1 ribosomal protein S18 acetylase RimI-like enzyme [Arthrobacter psychrochitiniphilus]PXA66792.1 GNAT family N-acetyltransferase [Arthrobacter psychrochitiniphilus]